MTNPQTEREPTDLERRLAGASTTRVSIEVLQETHDDLLEVISRNGWDTEEGLRVLLTMGLGYAQGKRFLEADDEEQQRLARYLAELESVAAVMRFNAYGLLRDNQVLEMGVGANRNHIRGLENLVRRLQEENAQLRARLDGIAGNAGTGCDEPPRASDHEAEPTTPAVGTQG